MDNVYREIFKWIADQPYWQQYALAKIVEKKDFENKDYDQLLQLVLEDNGLTEKKTTRNEIKFALNHEIESQDTKKIILNEIFDLENINALIENQHLIFGNNLTVIFGENGSGKSGYARVLGDAGFKRGPNLILPDVTKPIIENLSQTAKIRINVDDEEQIYTHIINSDLSTLKTFYVFDSESVQSHLSDKNNKFNFSPAGLSILEDLSKVIDEVKSRLTSLIEQNSKPKDYQKYFSESSEISTQIIDWINTLNIVELKTLAKISPSLNAREAELNILIGNIKLNKISDDLEKLTNDILKLKKLDTWLNEAYIIFNDQNISSINTLVTNYLESQKIFEEINIDQFKTDKLSQVGTTHWIEFIHSAHQLSIDEFPSEKVYPTEEDICLLCHQPLSKDATKLILQLWKYIDSDIRNKINEIQTQLDNHKQKIQANNNFQVDADFSDQIMLINSEDELLSSSLSSQIERCKSYRSELLIAIENHKIFSPKDELINHSKAIDSICTKFETSKIELSEQDQHEELIKYESELLTIQHKKLLNKLIDDIEEYINKRKWAIRAAKINVSTSKITRKTTSIFDELVKERYIDIFSQYLEDLGRPLEVSISTSGTKGESKKHLEFKSQQARDNKKELKNVLSEGEKRAVTLADFLTEVKLDTTSNGIILDDPVTSFDLELRHIIARVLVKEAKTRQVIIFTHDLPFHVCLNEEANKNNTLIESHLIQRGNIQPGYVSLNDGPISENLYRKTTHAEKYLHEAETTDLDRDKILILKQGFSALRTSYEALVIYDILGGVVTRFQKRLKFGCLKMVVYDNELIKQVIENHQVICDYMEGHLPTDGFSIHLTPGLLSDEIDKYNDLRTQIIAIQNSRKES